MTGMRICVYMFCMYSVIWDTIHGHRPLPDGITCGEQFSDSTSALNIPDPSISWAAHRLITCDEPVFWLKATFTDLEDIMFTAGVPIIERFADVQVNLVIIGPELPPLNTSAYIPSEIREGIEPGEGALLIEAPEDQSECNYVMSEELSAEVDVQEERCTFVEQFTNTASYVMFDDIYKNTSAGEYRFALYNRRNTTAKIWYPSPRPWVRGR